ncbi:hypothetical protein TWF569_010785 [Orbilia oligospora]|nr:hypothetical protein TWF594_002502 [Orbilia oligospora]KAF3132802.1 hypothetical protein TWF569_010785 [Orbilia oligospora]
MICMSRERKRRQSRALLAIGCGVLPLHFYSLEENNNSGDGVDGVAIFEFNHLPASKRCIAGGIFAIRLKGVYKIHLICSNSSAAIRENFQKDGKNFLQWALCKLVAVFPSIRSSPHRVTAYGYTIPVSLPAPPARTGRFPCRHPEEEEKCLEFFNRRQGNESNAKVTLQELSSSVRTNQKKTSRRAYVVFFSFFFRASHDYRPTGILVFSHSFRAGQGEKADDRCLLFFLSPDFWPVSCACMQCICSL